MWCYGVRTTNPQTEASHRMHLPRRLKKADMSTQITACPHLWGWRQLSTPPPPQHGLFTPLPSGQKCKCVKWRTSKLGLVRGSLSLFFFFATVACFDFRLWVSVKCPWDQWHIKAEAGAHSWTISCSDCKVGVICSQTAWMRIWRMILMVRRMKRTKTEDKAVKA